MSGTSLFEDPRALDRLAAVIDAPPIIHVRTTILVHDRSTSDTRCPCGACGLTTASVTEVRPDLDLVIERTSGRRLHRHQVRPDLWGQVIEGAEEVAIPLVVFRSQLDIVLSEDRLLCVDGGAQSGKTEGLARWFLRQVLLHGGPGRTSWLMAPSRRSCFIMAQKALLGYQGRPPLIPPSMILRSPKFDTDSNLKILLVDGTVIDLRPCDRKDGSRADGQECFAVWMDEVSKIIYPLYWHEASNRTTATRGPVAGSSVPLPGHWYEEIVSRVVDTDRRREEGEEGLPSSRHWTISRFDNYAVSEADIREQEALMTSTHGPLACRLHIYGEWVRGDSKPFWRHWAPDRMAKDHVPRDIRLERHPVSGEYFLDVTASAIEIAAPGGGWFSGHQRASNRRWVLGMDVNQSPCTALVCQVFALSPSDPPDRWGIYVLDEVSRDFATLSEFSGVLTTVSQGDYRGTLVIVDPQNCHQDLSILRSGGERRGNASAKALSEAGFDARPCSWTVHPGQLPTPTSPSRRDSHDLLHKMMLEGRLFVSSRCARLLEGLERQEADPRQDYRLPVKVAGNKSDKLSNAIDGLRYLCWAIWGTRPEISHRHLHSRTGQPAAQGRQPFGQKRH